MPRFIDNARGPSTVRAYASDWRPFVSWCAEHGHQALPAAPAVVACTSQTFRGEGALATIQRRLTSISMAHQEGGHDTPTRATVVRGAWRGIRRTFGTAQEGKAPAANRRSGP